ncbi:hypothetical protein LPN04_31335 [Rugamonas sp. A1-17]|nr:hypothetical protein [Rugamonas sp. A1-17]
MIDLEEQKRLVVEIFAITGCKVDADDPVIVAALFYSENLRTSLQAHQKQVEKVRAESRLEIAQLHSASLEQFQKAIDTAVKQLSSQADTSRVRLDKQFADLITVAKQAAHGEVPGIKRELGAFFDGLRKAVKPKLEDEFPMTLTKLGCCLAIAAAASVFGTAIWFGKVNITEMVDAVVAQTRQQVSPNAPPDAMQAKRVNAR